MLDPPTGKRQAASHQAHPSTGKLQPPGAVAGLRSRHRVCIQSDPWLVVASFAVVSRHRARGARPRRRRSALPRVASSPEKRTEGGSIGGGATTTGKQAQQIAFRVFTDIALNSFHMPLDRDLTIGHPSNLDRDY